MIKALITGMLCVAGQVNAQVPDLTAGELPVMVVGKVEWGANGTAKDRMTLYLPGTDLVLGAPVAVVEGVVSQEDGSFDTLALHAIADVSHSYDEIRFGSSYAAVAAVGDAYTTWATSFSLENPWVTLANPALNGEPTADLDGDGVTNKGEYAFGLNPTSGASSNPIVSQLNKTTGKFSYTRRATPASTGIVYTVTTSPDLVAWPNDNPATAGQVVTGTVDGVETVEVTLTGTPLTGSKRFVQIKAE